MKIALALDDVQKAELDLAHDLRQLAEHHAVEHDIYHLGHARARLCDTHVERIRPFVEPYGAHAQHVERSHGASSMLEAMRRTASELMGREQVVGLVLLHGLRDVYLSAQLVEIDWTILTHAAKAARDASLLDVVCDCHAESEATAKWLRTRIKVSSGQVLAAR
jgi:hypothetical protein